MINETDMEKLMRLYPHLTIGDLKQKEQVQQNRGKFDRLTFSEKLTLVRTGTVVDEAINITVNGAPERKYNSKVDNKFKRNRRI